MVKRFLAVVLLLLVLLPTQAQDEGQLYLHSLSYREGIREFTGAITHSNDQILITISNLPKDFTIYLFVQGEGNFDPLVGILDGREYALSDGLPNFLAGDDNSGGGTNALLQYTSPKTSDYYIVIFTTSGIGSYRIVIGVNTPEVLQEAISDTTFNSNMNSAASFNCDSAVRASRPILSGSEQRMEAANFVIHYTLEGEDATTPEYAAVLLVSLDNALRFQTETLGWVLPPQDCGEGGDPRLDVYLVNIRGEEYGYSPSSQIYGLAHKDNFVGDNPNTPGREVNAAYSHLVIDNDMAFDSIETDPLYWLQYTAVHEMHHNVQFGYDALDYYYGFYEGGAVWIQVGLHPDETVIRDTTAGVFEYPDVCVGSEPLYDAGFEGFSRIYGEWLMIDSLSRDLGQTAYQRIWEQLILEQGLTGFYNALAQMNTTPQDVMKRMAIRNLLHDYPMFTGGEHTVRLEGTVATTGEYTPVTSGVQQLGVDYMRVTLPPNVYSFEVSGRGMELFLVGIDAATQTAQVFSLKTAGNVDISPFTHTYLIILNTQQHLEPLDCEFTDWRLAVYDAAGSATTPADYDIWDASRFIAAD